MFLPVGAHCAHCITRTCNIWGRASSVVHIKLDAPAALAHSEGNPPVIWAKRLGYSWTEYVLCNNNVIGTAPIWSTLIAASGKFFRFLHTFFIYIRALEYDLISQWCDQPFEEKKKSPRLKVSLWFNNRHTLEAHRGLNQSEIVKGGLHYLWLHYLQRCPLWLAVVQIFMYVCVSDACAAAVRQREVSSRDARSVANFERFSVFLDPHSYSKKATSDKSSDFLDKL